MISLGKTKNVAETTKHFAVYYPLGKTLGVRNYAIASRMIDMGEKWASRACRLMGRKWKVVKVEWIET